MVREKATPVRSLAENIHKKVHLYEQSVFPSSEKNSNFSDLPSYGQDDVDTFDSTTKHHSPLVTVCASEGNDIQLTALQGL